jgi:hypothetical protein
MFRKVGYTRMQWASDQAVRLTKYSYSNRHCDVMQWRTVSPCFAFHLIQPEQEWESEKGKRVEQKIESFRLRCSTVLIGSIRHQSDCAAGLEWNMTTTRVSFFQRRKSADRSSTKCTQRVSRPSGSNSGGPGFDSRLVSRVPLLRHRKIELRPSKVMLHLELQNIAVSILGHFQIPR